MATMLLVLTSIWFAWGYRYKFSAFDMNTAFILVDGRLSIPAATLCIVMQQLIPVAVALALMGHPGTALETGKKTTAVSGFLLSSQCITTLAVIPFFLEEGWTFLRAVHVIWFQALLFCLLCGSALLLGFSCAEHKSR